MIDFDDLTKGQKEAFDAVMSAIKNKDTHITINGYAGTGKEQSVDTFIQTPTGKRRFGDLVIGDLVIGKNGKPTKVVGIYPQGIKSSYEFTFRDGSKTRAGLDHNWAIESKRSHKKISVKTTKGLLDAGLIDSNGNYKFKVPLCDAVDYTKKNLPIHPYVLGALIGDGCLVGSTINLSCADLDCGIINTVRELLPDVTISTHRTAKTCAQYGFTKSKNFKSDIVSLGLNVKSIDKFIPIDYKLSSIEDRRQLLAGLMDTDGSSRGNRISFSTISKTLALDVIELVQSLGGTAILHTLDRTHDDKGIEYSVNVKVLFNPFNLERKAKNWKLSTKNPPSRYITSIEYVGEEEQMCIQVDADDHLYLTDDYIVTHNTTLTKFILEKLIEKGVDGIMLAAPTHAAKKVLTNLSGMEANTIHSILKINPTTYEDSTTFEQKEVPDLAKCRVLFCDEGSMYDKKLYDIMMNTIPKWCTVIALGDVAQIRPVEPGSTVTSISPFFTDKRFKVVSLTEVMRSNAPIIKVATDIRNGSFIYEHLDENGSGVHGFRGENAFIEFMKTYFSKVKTPEDLFENRMIAFTNKSVDKLNKIIRKRIYNTTEPFIENEVIVMQEPLMVEHTFAGKTLNEIVFNNGEFVKVERITVVADNIQLPNVSDSYLVSYYRLEVSSLDEPDVVADINVIVDDREYEKYAMVLSKAAQAYKSGAVKASWKAYWKLRRKFTKVKPLPCGTIHKSQGMTVDNIFVYSPCIHVADGELAQQLLYVAATRARHEVYYV